MASNQRIPAGVYFNAQHDNFYNAGTRLAMGAQFYRRWSPRFQEFPWSAEQARAAQQTNNITSATSEAKP